MDNKKSKKDDKSNQKYGEFIPTEFSWITPEKQKEIAEKLDKITKENK